MFLIVVLISVMVYWIVMQKIKTRQLNLKLKNFPGINSAYPLLGDALLWTITKWSIQDKIKHFIDVIRDYPTTLKVWFGSKVVLIINNPKDVKTVLTSPYCTDKTSIYHMTIGGEGLFVANGNKWKNQRRHLNTAFSPHVLKSYENEYNQFGRNIVTALKEYSISGKEFDITPLVGIYGTDLFTRTIYGSTQHKFELSKHCYEVVERLMIFWGERMLQIYFHIFIILFRKIFGIVSEDKKLNKELRCGLQPIFDQKLNEYQNNVKPYESNLNTKNEYFLEKLTRLRFEGAIGLSEYRHTSMSMFLAGTETTARSISIIMLMLAIHQEYQDKIYEEVHNFFEVYDYNTAIDISKLNELNLLGRFIKETFRLFPVVPFFGRISSRDIPITEGVIPAGIDIYISVVNIHQHRQIWGEDPMKFNPDNFLPEAVANRDKCSYLPFSYGPRNCIGYKFAQISTCVAILYLLKHYQFRTTLKFEDIKIGYGMTTSLLNDNLISIQPRNLNNKNLLKNYW